MCAKCGGLANILGQFHLQPYLKSLLPADLFYLTPIRSRFSGIDRLLHITDRGELGDLLEPRKVHCGDFESL